MAFTITLKQNDTRPVQVITLLEPDPTDPTGKTTRVVDLTDASSARILVEISPDTGATFTSVLDLAIPLTSGACVYTPVGSDTTDSGEGTFEVEVTWSDGGIETFPNDGTGTFIITPEIPG